MIQPYVPYGKVKKKTGFLNQQERPFLRASSDTVVEAYCVLGKPVYVSIYLRRRKEQIINQDTFDEDGL
jgi:hypothetical protein